MDGCIYANYDPDEGRYKCSVTDGYCMYKHPNSARCADEYCKGPDAVKEDEHGA